MSYFQMTDDLFKRYSADPKNLNTDREIRNKANVPDNRYYTVSMWPENLQGRVYVNTTMFRAVKAEKISKSNQS